MKCTITCLLVFLTLEGANAADTNRALGPWLMDLQLGKPDFELPEKINPAELAQAPPEIKEMVQKTQRHFAAREKLRQLGTNAVALLFDRLRTSKDLKQKEQALIALDHLQPPPQMVLPGLSDYLNSGELAETAGLVLARQGPLAIVPLTAARTNRNSKVRSAVAGHLADFHPDEKGNLRISINGDERIWPNFKSAAGVIAPALLELLEDEVPEVRYHAAIALGQVGGDPSRVGPALTRHLNDSDAIVRSDAAEALGHFGKDAAPAIPALGRNLRDPDESVRLEAAYALKLIGSNLPKDVPAVELGLKKIKMTATAGCNFLVQPDAVIISGDGRLQTKEEFTSPVVIRAVAKTDVTNIRLYFAQGFMILNWELNPREMRLHDPRTGKANAIRGQGYIEPNTWHDIQWNIAADSMQVLVDGIERVSLTGDYSGIRSAAGIGAAHGSNVTVKDFEVHENSAPKKSAIFGGPKHEPGG